MSKEKELQEDSSYPKSVVEVFQAKHPHGHPDFAKYLLEDIKLHSAKNFSYAHGGPPLGNFQRVANIMSNYPKFPIDKPKGVLYMNMMKQLDSIMWAMCNEKTPPKDHEQDLTIYSGIARCMNNAT